MKENSSYEKTKKFVSTRKEKKFTRNFFFLSIFFAADFSVESAGEVEKESSQFFLYRAAGVAAIDLLFPKKE